MSHQLRTYKYRFYPTAEQKHILAQQFGGGRWVYNVGLEMIRNAWERDNRRISYVEVGKQLTLAKATAELGWLREIDSGVVTQKLRDLDSAYSHFFRRIKQGKTGKESGYPKFKGRSSPQSVRFVFDVRSAGKVRTWNDGKLVLPKLGICKLRWSRRPAAGYMPKLVTVRMDSQGRYWVTMAITEPVEPLLVVGKSVGIDVGISALCSLSDGEKIANPKALGSMLRALRRAGRSLSRKQAGTKGRGRSNRYRRQQRRVAVLHGKVANIRSNAIHQATSTIVRESQVIAIESLNVKGMMQNRKLSRALNDAGLAEFHRQIRYKAQWYGRTVVAVDQWFASSKLCSCCGYKSESMPLSVRQWQCPVCHTIHDRDTNASSNILLEGLRLLLPEGVGKVMRVEGDTNSAVSAMETTGHSLKRESRQTCAACTEQAVNV